MPTVYLHQRYGLQFQGTVKTTNEQPTQALMNSIQFAQNKFARFLNGNKLNDRVPTESTLKDLKMLSVNQINAQIKLSEVWKSLNYVNYPTKWEQKMTKEDERKTRATEAKIVPETAKTTRSQATFDNDAKKVWNKAPAPIKDSKSLSAVKKLIRSYVKTLPI